MLYAAVYVMAIVMLLISILGLFEFYLPSLFLKISVVMFCDLEITRSDTKSSLQQQPIV